MLKGTPADAEAAARRVNAEPWEPMPGMVKLQYPDCRYWFADCRYWFAAPHPRATYCPDCEIKRQRRLAAATATAPR